MFGGVGKAGWATILAGGVLLGGSISAQAADLGGDCCADLEERIAELEATTARKGNRKVKLSIYGKVNQALMWWDDGVEQNVYAVTNDASRTRFGFKGGAKISDDLSANFRIEVGIRTANSKRNNQNDAINIDETGFDVRHSWWNLKSKTLGTAQVGWTPTASQKATEQNLAGTSSVGKYTDIEDSGGGFFLVNAATGVQSADQWRRLLKHSGDPPGEGDRRNAVLYESPAFAGFSVLAAWGGDDFWDVGLHYENEVGDFEIAAAIAYAQNSAEQDEDATMQCVVTAGGADCESVGGSISVMHKPSGLYTNFAAGWFQDEGVNDAAIFNQALNPDDTSTFYAIEAGLQQKWISLGKTTVFGQYYDYDGGANDRTNIAGGDSINSFGATAAEVFSSEVEMWGLGVMQKIDAADMKLYALYRHYEFGLTLTDDATVQASNPLEDFDVIMTGAEIKF